MTKSNIIVFILAMSLSACGGGGGGNSGSGGNGSGTPTITNVSISYSSDDTTKTVTTSYSDGTTSSHSFLQTSITYSFSADGRQRTPTYTYSDGSTHSGATQTATSTTYSYVTDGSQRTPTYTYPDGTTQSGATQTATSTTYSYVADGRQRTPTYTYPDGTTHDGAPQMGTIKSSNYNLEGSRKTIVYSFPGGTDHSVTLIGTQSITWSDDHITKTIKYTFADNSSTSRSETVQPNNYTPSLMAAHYPSDWSSGTSTQSVTAPVTSAKQKVYGDGFTEVSEDGSAVLPFLQNTLAPNGSTNPIRDPNAYVTFAADPKPINNNTETSMTFDLRWGTPDPKGPAYAAQFLSGTERIDHRLDDSPYVFEGLVSNGNMGGVDNNIDCRIYQSTTGCGPSFFAPTQDVIDAWQKGWTGKDTNILIWDDLFDHTYNSHPITVWTIAHLNAWSANFFGKSYDDTIIITKQQNGELAPADSMIKYHAINMSFGANRYVYFRSNPSATEQMFRAEFQQYTLTKLTTLKSTAYTDFSGGAHYDFHDAVITKAAGNDSGLDAQYDPWNYFLAHNVDSSGNVTANTEIVTRLLIVGALTKDGAASNKADLAYYSNKAGDDLLIQSRFLLASGTVPFLNGDLYYHSNNIRGSGGNNPNVGTSYAAPRVAGYAAIVRQKFPNLTGANTADILLATARYDTLSCYPNCDKAVYGQGEASLSRALAPVGYLH